MKVALVMIVCSQIAGECMSPHFLRHYDNLYNCLLGGYTEAIEKTEEIGKDDIIPKMLSDVISEKVDFEYNKKISLFSNQFIDKLNSKLFEGVNE